ncbi:aldose epimerase family protein [Enterococcus sp. LJL51]|uniref:aldose epimerase family protein n=1 Tax=Enterococcus sp. LJL51 TaxID=3416656 RepID=UPI003CF987E6
MKTHIHKNYYDSLDLIVLENEKLKVSFLNLGARLYQLFAPDRSGASENILLSHDEPLDVLKDQAFFGAVVGPVAGRTREGKWGAVQLEQNEGKHHIHGGSQGWSFQYWDYQTFQEIDRVGVRFSLTDNLSGYPGPITVAATYELTKDTLLMKMTYQTAAHTLINPTNHAYFNLSGNGKRDIDAQLLQIQAKQRVVTDNDKLPTGELQNVQGTPFDFTTSKPLSHFLKEVSQGLDDVFILDTVPAQLLLSDPVSGRRMEITTSRQSVVVFSTTDFNASFIVNGRPMHSNYGIALETQEIPDLVHHPQWGSIDYTSDSLPEHRTTYRFTTE